jgi:hypothetical protein
MIMRLKDLEDYLPIKEVSVEIKDNPYFEIQSILRLK